MVYNLGRVRVVLSRGCYVATLQWSFRGLRRLVRVHGVRAYNELVRGMSDLAYTTLTRLYNGLSPLYLSSKGLYKQLSRPSVKGSCVVGDLCLSFGEEGVLGGDRYFLRHRVRRVMGVLVLVLCFRNFSIVSLAFTSLT